MNLTVKDGFNFGCGFFIAAVIYSAVVTFAFFFMLAIFGTGLAGALVQ